MVVTINEFLLPVFLFAVYSCAVSLLICRPHSLESVKSENSEILSLSHLTIDRDDFFPTEQLMTESEEISFISEDGDISYEQAFPKVQPKEIPDSGPDNLLYLQTETIINNLKKRQSRQICKPLGIQQKSGKVEMSLTSIKTELYRLFQENPERVIAVIGEKLLVLISTPWQASETNDKIAS